MLVVVALVGDLLEMRSVVKRHVVTLGVMSIGVSSLVMGSVLGSLRLSDIRVCVAMSIAVFRLVVVLVFVTAALVRSESAFVVSVVLHGLFVRVVVATCVVVLLRFVTRIAIITVLRLVMSGISWGKVMLPVTTALMTRDLSPFSGGLVIVRSCTVVLGLMLSLVVAVLVVVRVGGSDFLGVGVVVTSLGDDVVFLRSSHSEVLRLVLLALVMIGIILVTMGVLRGHVVVVWVLIVMRLIGVSLVVLVS